MGVKHKVELTLIVIIYLFQIGTAHRKRQSDRTVPFRATHLGAGKRRGVRACAHLLLSGAFLFLYTQIAKNGAFVCVYCVQFINAVVLERALLVC